MWRNVNLDGSAAKGNSWPSTHWNQTCMEAVARAGVGNGGQSACGSAQVQRRRVAVCPSVPSSVATAACGAYSRQQRLPGRRFDCLKLTVWHPRECRVRGSGAGEGLWDPSEESTKMLAGSTRPSHQQAQGGGCLLSSVPSGRGMIKFEFRASRFRASVWAIPGRRV